MQPTRNLVTAVVEFSTRVEDGHDDFRGRSIFLLVQADWDTAAVILDRQAPIRKEFYIDLVAVACHGLVDGIVDDFVNHVVQPGPIVRIADVHSGTSTNGLQTLQDMNTAGVV